MGNFESQPEILWSRDMIMNSLDQIGYALLSQCLPQSFIDYVNNIETVIPHSELEKKLAEVKLDETLVGFSSFTPEIMDDLKRLRMHPAFAEIVGLEGALNNLVDHGDGKEPLYLPNREWLYILAMKIDEKERILHPELPSCSKYVALYEADKIARKLNNNRLVHISPETIATTVEQCYTYPIMMAASLANYNITKNQAEKCLFEDSDYYLLPEFSYKFTECGKSQIENLKWAREQYRHFFAKMAKFPLFYNYTIISSDTIDIDHTTIKLPMHIFPSASQVMFSRTVVQFLNQNVKGAKKIFESVKELPFSKGFPMTGNPMDVVTNHQYSCWISEKLSDISNCYPTIFEYEPLNWSPLAYLPILSENYQLCLPSSVAFDYFQSMFTENTTVLDSIPIDQLDRGKQFINNYLDILQPDKEAISMTDFKNFRKVVYDWKKFITNRYLNFIDDGGTPSEFCSMLYLDRQKLLEKHYHNEKPVRELAFFIEFPKAAILMHNQKQCKTICEKVDDSFCLLDLVEEDKVPNMKRCDIPMESDLVKSLRTNRQNICEQNVGKSDSSVASSREDFVIPEPYHVITEHKVSGLEKGFLNISNPTKSVKYMGRISRISAETEQVENESSNSTSTTGNSPTLPQNHSESKYLNALKQLLFPKTFADLPVLLTIQIENIERFRTFDEFTALIRGFISYFTPFEDKTYCRCYNELIRNLALLVDLDTSIRSSNENSSISRKKNVIIPLFQLLESSFQRLESSKPVTPTDLWIFDNDFKTLIDKHCVQNNSIKIRGDSGQYGGKRFYYTYYSKARMEKIGILKKKSKEGRDFEKQITSCKMYGQCSCTPIMSPFNVPCKPAHFIVRDFFNFLNYELNIFRSIRQECIPYLRQYIKSFCDEFNIAEEAQFCISIDAFNRFLEEGRTLFATMMKSEVCRMYVPTNDDMRKRGGNYVFEMLEKNVNPGILFAHNIAIGNLKTFTALNVISTPWFKLIDEAIYKSFILEFPELCDMIHHQKQCNKWSQCLLDLHNRTVNEDGKSCEVGHDVGTFMWLETTFMHKRRVLKESETTGEHNIDIQQEAIQHDTIPFEDVRKQHLMMLNKITASQQPSTSSKKPPTRPIAVQPIQPCTSSRESSSSSTRPEKIVQKVQPIEKVIEYIYNFRTCPIPEVKVDVLLFNTSILKNCLKMILDDMTYQSVVKRRSFKAPGRKEWFDWAKVVEIIDRVKNVIPNPDSVLTDIKGLRMSDGSSTLFKTAGCIDWQNPNVVSISNEKRKTHNLKQNWIKALPFDDYFYPNERDKKLFRILEEYQLDQLAATIGTSEIVTLKCPQEDLHNLMIDVKLKIKMNKNKMDDILVEILKKDTGMDEQMISQLKEYAFGSTIDHSAEVFEEILAKMLKDCHDDIIKKKELAKHVVYKIHKAQMIRKALCEVDKFGITRKNNMKEMTNVPIIRTARNDTIVFEEEYRLGFDVAKFLKEDKHESTCEVENDSIRTFNYVLNKDMEHVSRSEGFKDVPFEMICLESFEFSSNFKMPILSPIYTLCIEASIILEEILNILTKEKKILDNLDAKNIDILTIFIDNLMEYFKPEKASTFCLDYHKAMELLEVTRKRFENFASEIVRPGKKSSVESPTDKKVFTSFEPMISSIQSDNLSRKEVEELTDMAHIRTVLYEYAELGIAYHNQRMCCSDGRMPYCPIDYLDKSDNDIGYDLPKSCNFTSTDALETFEREMKILNVTRMKKCVVENSKNKLKLNLKTRDSDPKELTVEKSPTPPEVAGVETSTQTDTPLAWDGEIQAEKKTLQNDIRRMQFEIDGYKKDITRLEKAKKAGEDQLKGIQTAAGNKERNLNKEIAQLKKKVAEYQKVNENNRQKADESMEKQKKLTEDWRMKYEREVRANVPSTSTARNSTVKSTVNSYLCHIGEASDKLEAARQKLASFLALSSVDSDKKRAEMEFENFEMDVELSIRKTQKNLAALENDANTDSDLLFKIESCPKPFSQLTFAKMLSAEEAKEREDNPECGICLVVLKIADDLFHCPIIVNGRQCGFTMHLDCFEKWTQTNSKCPQCGRVVVNPNEYPLP